VPLVPVLELLLQPGRKQVRRLVPGRVLELVPEQALALEPVLPLQPMPEPLPLEPLRWHRL
jgi:hypothetical protein